MQKQTKHNTWVPDVSFDNRVSKKRSWPWLELVLVAAIGLTVVWPHLKAQATQGDREQEKVIEHLEKASPTLDQG